MTARRSIRKGGELQAIFDEHGPPRRAATELDAEGWNQLGQLQERVGRGSQLFRVATLSIKARAAILSSFALSDLARGKRLMRVRLS